MSRFVAFASSAAESLALFMVSDLNGTVSGVTGNGANTRFYWVSHPIIAERE